MVVGDNIMLQRQLNVTKYSSEFPFNKVDYEYSKSDEM